MRITAKSDSKDEESLISKIKEALKYSLSNATYVTGHSLGGAMAVITSGMVWIIQIECVYTYVLTH